MQRHLRVTIGLVLACGAAGPARGLTLLTDDRFIGTRINGAVYCCVEPDFFAPFDATLGASFQQSSISVSSDGLGFDASARVIVHGVLISEPITEWREIVGQASFSIGFETAQASTLQIAGRIGAIGVAQQYAVVRLLAGSQVLFERFSSAAGGEQVDSSIGLAPGTYQIEATPFVSGYDADASVDLEFHLREVPEPGAWLLLGLGVVGLAAFPR